MQFTKLTLITILAVSSTFVEAINLRSILKHEEHNDGKVESPETKAIQSMKSLCFGICLSPFAAEIIKSGDQIERCNKWCDNLINATPKAVKSGLAKVVKKFA